MPGYRQTIPYCYCIAQHRISPPERVPFLATNPKMRVTRRGCSGGWGEGDGVAEGLQLVYVVALLSVWV